MEGHRITIADDDADALFLLNTMPVRMYPHSSIAMFSNARDALSHILETGTDLLITNHGMGVMTGTDLIRVLRQKNINIPIIMVSGNPEVRSEAASAGATVFVEKTLSNKLLEEQIRRLVPD
jgi:FixJ family two-component response regulator